MNLRGTVLPVVDLRMKFRLPAVEYNKFTVIVIATVGNKDRRAAGRRCFQMFLWSRTMQCARRPDFGSAVDTRFINGVFESRETSRRRVEPRRTSFRGELALPQSIAA